MSLVRYGSEGEREGRRRRRRRVREREIDKTETSNYYGCKTRLGTDPETA